MLRKITSMIKEVVWLRKREHADNDDQETYCLNSADKAQRSRTSPRRMTSRVTRVQPPIPLSSRVQTEGQLNAFAKNVDQTGRRVYSRRPRSSDGWTARSKMGVGMQS